MSSDTPRTDSVSYDTGLRCSTNDLPDMVVSADFARQLERELSQARAAGALEGMRATAEWLSKQEFFHDGLSADLHEVKDKAHAYIMGWQDAIAELRAEIARLEKEHAAPSGAGQNAGEEARTGENPIVGGSRLSNAESPASPAPFKETPKEVLDAMFDTGIPLSINDADKLYRAILSASPAPAVPEGMVMVPKHILRDAIEQCPCTLRERDSGHRIGCIAPTLQDLLAAAPKQEGQHDPIEYDGAFKCLKCGAQWGALPGNLTMPEKCEVTVKEDKP